MQFLSPQTYIDFFNHDPKLSLLLIQILSQKKTSADFSENVFLFPLNLPRFCRTFIWIIDRELNTLQCLKLAKSFSKLNTLSQFEI